jgi:proteasome lid subunit RPN8/RPN11
MAFSEECWALRGLNLDPVLWIWREQYISKGSGASVNFDWEKAWDDKSIIGWRHTHPGTNFDFPSSVDDRTMKSWVKATGKSMICGVTCGTSTKYYLYGANIGGDMDSELRYIRIPVLGVVLANQN